MKLLTRLVVLLALTSIKADSDCSRCAKEMSAFFKAFKAKVGFEPMAKVMYQAICAAEPSAFPCQDQDGAKTIDSALQAITLSEEEAIFTCYQMPGACDR